MIDAIHHLGVAYHFEVEINDTLKKIHRDGFEESKDLHTIALGFRLLRQQRFLISADIFNKFMKKGDFDESLKRDGKGLLSLYEAAHLGTQNEKILENAVKFARTHLKLMLGNMDKNFATITSRALERPRFRRSERLEAREYISIFEEEKNRSELLLEFAKLDFHLVQSIHLEELLHLTLWKNSIALSENLPFARDRLVELNFWMTGTYFEPSYSRARIMATKLIVLTSILDDIYDQYGTLEDLELLTEKIERWELLRVDQLPKYLQCFCMSLYKTFKDFDDELSFEQNSFRVRFLENEMKKLAHAFFVEARWGNEHYIPNIQEHLHISLCSCAYPLVFCALFLGMHEVIPLNVYEWLTEFPEIVKASCIICRIMNDITSDEHEERDNHFATIVESYTKEKKCTKEEARDKLRVMVEDAWKTLNQEYLLSNLPLFIVQIVIKLSRMLELFYKDKDNYTNPFGFIKDKIKLLMVDPILSNLE
ncbi:alpha-humulene synthase-like isoform X2 [Dendrobium catenatum]|nr:alpha-humulene synthase-like isoform X2 [Dendrobium catenatum]